MQTTTFEQHGIRILACSADGAKIDNERAALDLIGEALHQRAGVVLIPAKCLPEAFFELKTRLAGEMIQKFVNYQRRLVILGDISRHIEQSTSLHDFVYEANRGRHVWFLQNVEELSRRLEHEAAEGSD